MTWHLSAAIIVLVSFAACARPSVPSEEEAEYGAYAAALREEFGADTQAVVLAPQTALANPYTPRGRVEDLFEGMDTSLLAAAIASGDAQLENRFPSDIIAPVLVPQERIFAVVRASPDSVAPGAPGVLWLSPVGLNERRDQALLSITQRLSAGRGSQRFVWLERDRRGWRVRDRAVSTIPVDSTTRAEQRHRMEAEMRVRQSAPVREVQPVEYEVYAAVLRTFVRDSAGRSGVIVIPERTNEYGPPITRMAGTAVDAAALDDYAEKAAHAPLLRRFEGVGSYRLLSPEEYRAIFSEGPYAGWPRFYERFPDAAGIVELSRAGISADGARAVVYMTHMRGSLDAVSRIVTLERTDAAWRVTWNLITAVA